MQRDYELINFERCFIMLCDDSTEEECLRRNFKNLDFWGSLSDPDFRFWVIRNCQRVDQPKVGAGVIELGIV